MDVVGERRGQSSQIAPDSTLDNFVGQQVASGLATASIVVLGNVLSSALECAPFLHPFFYNPACSVCVSVAQTISCISFEHNRQDVWLRKPEIESSCLGQAR